MVAKSNKRRTHRGIAGTQSLRPHPIGRHDLGSSNRFSVEHKGFTAYFVLSHHACARLRERGLDLQKVRTTIERVRHLLRNLAGHNMKIVIPEYSKGCALLVKFEGCRATVITILRYPDMALPAGVKVVDWRSGLD
jgi:hypothetical protein